MVGYKSSDNRQNFDDALVLVLRKRSQEANPKRGRAVIAKPVVVLALAIITCPPPNSDACSTPNYI